MIRIKKAPCRVPRTPSLGERQTLGLNRQAARLRLPNRSSSLGLRKKLRRCGCRIPCVWRSFPRISSRPTEKTMRYPTKLPVGLHIDHSNLGRAEAMVTSLGRLQQNPRFSASPTGHPANCIFIISTWCHGVVLSPLMDILQPTRYTILSTLVYNRCLPHAHSAS